jgi:release factor glutamine methyltransferase
MEETWTILKLIQWTTQYFTGKGIAQPRADAEVLLSHVLGMERIQLYLKYDQPLQSVELAAYRSAVRRRAAQEPVQYIIGHQEFWSLDLEVSPSVLIPRPETEILVERALTLLKEKGSTTPVILDVGTGSGAIAIALAHELPMLRIIAADVSSAALAVARRNATHHRVAERIHLVAMDLFSALSDNQTHFDLIVSNPPYIANTELTELAPEIVDREPHTALLGGPQGLTIIRRILEDAWCFLKPGAPLLVEIGQGQAPALAEELAINPHYHGAQFIDDHAGIARILQVRQNANAT